MYHAIILIIIGLISCRGPNGSNRKRFSSSEVSSNDQQNHNGTAQPQANYDDGAYDDIERLFSLSPTFGNAFPEIKDRFFIDSMNNVYYDFMASEGQWNLEKNAMRLIDLDEASYLEIEPDDTPNLLFPSYEGVFQFQPIRRRDGSIIVFYTDQNKNLYVKAQIIAKSMYWADPIELDTSIERFFPYFSDGKIQLSYIKNKDNQQIMLKRSLDDQDSLNFSPITIDNRFTQANQMKNFLTLMKQAMEDHKIIIVSMKQADLGISVAIKEGKQHQRDEMSQFHLTTGVGSAYGDGALKNAWTREGSFGDQISSSDGWDSPHDICSNVATALVLAPVVASGPVGAVFTLGMASGLQDPETGQLSTQQQGAVIDDQAYLMIKEDEISESEDDMIMAPVDEDEFQELTEDDIQLIKSQCSGFMKTVTNGLTLGRGIAEADEEMLAVGEFCMELDIASNQLPQNNENADFTQEDEDAQLALGPEVLAGAFLVHKGSYAAWKRAKGTTIGPKFLLGSVAFVLFPGVVIVSSMVYGMYKSFRFFNSEKSMQFFSEKTRKISEKYNKNIRSELSYNKKFKKIDDTIQVYNEKIEAAKESKEKEKFEAKKAHLKAKKKAFEEYKLTRDFRISERKLASNEKKLTKKIKKSEKEYNFISEKIKESFSNKERPLSQKDAMREVELEKLRDKHQKDMNDAQNRKKHLEDDYNKKKKTYENHYRNRENGKDILDADGKIKTKGKLDAQGNAKPSKTADFKRKIAEKFNQIRGHLRNTDQSKKAIKSFPDKIARKIKGYPKFVKSTAQKNWSKKGAKKQTGMLGTAVLAGAVSEYGRADGSAAEKAEQSGVAGANTVVESPVGALEGLNGIHSTAGALCRGDLGTVLKNSGNLIHGLIAGSLDLTVGLTAMVCDGVKALADTSNSGVVSVSGKATCFMADGVKFVANEIVRPVANTTKTIINTGGDVIDAIGSIFLVAPDGSLIDEVSVNQGIGLVKQPIQILQGGLICLQDPRFAKTVNCYDRDPRFYPNAALKEYSWH